MNSILWLINTLVNLYIYCLIGSIIMHWLIYFNIVNPNQPFVRSLGEALYRLTEPLLAPIRRLMPDLGGLDLSPIILLILIHFTRSFFFELVTPLIY